MIHPEINTVSESIKVVIPDDYPQVISDSLALMRLKRQGRVKVSIFTEPFTDENQLITRIADAHTVIGMRATTQFTSRVFEASPSLRHLALWGTAIDNVDMDAAKFMGITISNTPGVATDAVAEHTLALMLALARRIPELDQRIRYNEWPRGILTQLSGKIIGVVGTGAVGRRMVRISHGIGMKAIVTSFRSYYGKENSSAWMPTRDSELVTFETLLREADVISVHTRVVPGVKHMFGRHEFSLMKPTAFFINTARGKLVDEDALAEALQNHTIAGAALDVFETEPIDRRSPLMHLPNVILSPHIAAVTIEALNVSLNMAVDNVIAYLVGDFERLRRLDLVYFS